ncbi:MAG: GDP-mannose 4,6-dehydratase [Planctomycetota bacterium]
MNIFVTGAAGFIGSHLIASLLSAGHTVTGVIRRAGMASLDSKRRLKNLDIHSAACQGKLTIIRGEDYETLYNALQKIRPEVCAHLAGKSWVRESIGYPELYEEANYKFTASLLEALRANGCRRVVFASSVMVYGKDAPLPFTEDALGSGPASPYGASKLSCEILLNTYHALHRLETINLRLFSVYGPELRPDCVPHLIATAILKGQPFNVFGDGNSLRDYVEIGDVVDALQATICGTTPFVTLNIGSGFGTTLLELIRQIEQCLGKKAEIVYKPAISGELTVAVPDISLAMRTIQWEPKINLEQGISRMAKWFKKIHR